MLRSGKVSGRSRKASTSRRTSGKRRLHVANERAEHRQAEFLRALRHLLVEADERHRHAVGIVDAPVNDVAAGLLHRRLEVEVERAVLQRFANAALPDRRRLGGVEDVEVGLAVLAADLQDRVDADLAEQAGEAVGPRLQADAEGAVAGGVVALAAFVVEGERHDRIERAAARRRQLARAGADDPQRHHLPRAVARRDGEADALVALARRCVPARCAE
jgi:hypothetical protein